MGDVVIEGDVVSGEAGSQDLGAVDQILSESDDSGSKKEDTQGNLEKMVENLTKEVQGLQSLEGRRANEFGHMKQMMEQQVANQNQASVPDDDTMSRFIDDPEGTIESMLSNINQKKANQKRSVDAGTMNALRTAAPDFDSYRSDIVKAIAKDVGSSEADIAEGLLDSGPGIPLNVYKRVKAEARVKELESLVESLKNTGVDIEGAKAFAKGSSSGESLGAPKDPLAGVSLRSLPKDKVQELYQKLVANKRR